jgi:hypothetical protein
MKTQRNKFVIPNFSREELQTAVDKSQSYANTFRVLGLSDCNNRNYYRWFHNILKIHTFDISHFKGRGWSKGQTLNLPSAATQLEKVLVKDKAANTNRLKKRLIKAELKQHQCEACGLTEWQNVPIPIELHHRDGDRNNNTLINLTILCPNCHALTDTYCGKNIKRYRAKLEKIKLNNQITNDNTPNSLPSSIYSCADCGRGIKTCGKRCIRCANINTAKTRKYVFKIDWPKTAELKKMVASTSYLFTGKSLGVTDNAVRKRIKNHPND